ncbi:unnamed protein product [Ectocarpus sp. 12 AP-2014]
MEERKSFDLSSKTASCFSKLRRGADLAPATLELKQTFALRRILLKHGERTEEECSAVRRFLAERTTIWREPFWALLSKREQLKIASCVKLRMVPSDGEPHDFVAADSTSGCMIFSALKGFAQVVQCFDSSGTRLEFQELETFGFLPVPEVLLEEAIRGVERVKSNPRSKVYRGEREYGERCQATTEAGKIRVKIAPDGQYLSINGAEVVPMLKKLAEKRGRSRLMKSMGLELPGMGGEGGFGGEVGGGGGGGGGRKREVLMREARYGVGSILVHEGASPTMVFVIVEGECRIVKSGKPCSQSHSSGAKVSSGRSARYNLGSAQGSKIDVVLTSGFHTQVDVCQLGSLGPKALIGDIPALLGGVQPASVVAKTPLRVLQCRADRFAAHLEHNARARKVYVEAAKARRSRMTERGGEVEQLVSLAGTPLLVDMSAGSASTSTGPAKHPGGNSVQTGDEAAHGSSNTSDQTGRGGKTERSTAGGKAAAATAANPTSTDRGRGRVSSRTDPSGTAKASSGKGVGPAVEPVPTHSVGSGHKESMRRSQSTPAATPVEEETHNTGTPADAAATARPAMRRTSSSESSPPTRGLNAERIVATASTPQLPCFSLGASPQLAFRGARPSPTVGPQHTPARKAIASSERKVASPVTDAIGASVSASGYRGRRLGVGVEAGLAGTAAMATPALATARYQASALLASHLTPFPTITKNRSLHAVAQPIVKHSEGFADACRGERSRSGTEAWRVAREARYEDLVAPADRLSIMRQIDAGFDALQHASKPAPAPHPPSSHSLSPPARRPRPLGGGRRRNPPISGNIHYGSRRGLLWCDVWSALGRAPGRCRQVGRFV